MEASETIKDIYEEIKNRLTSPFFGSFLISWLCINWYIPVALIFYNQTELKADHLNSYRELIRGEIDVLRNFVYPFFCAIAYIFLSPLIKAGINIYQAKIAVLSGDKIIDITNDAKEYKTKLLAKDQRIAEINMRLTDQTGKNLELAESMGRLKNEIENKNQEIQLSRINEEKAAKGLTDTNRYSDLELLNGRWVVQYFNPGLIERVWEISSEGQIYENQTSRYRIDRSIANGKKIWLYLIKMTDDAMLFNSWVIALEESNSTGTSLTGKDSNGKEIILKKMKQVWQPILE